MTTNRLHDWTAELVEFYGDSLDDPLVMQRFGQMCRAAANNPADWLKERNATDATPHDLPLFDSVEAPQVGTADAQDCSGRHVHPQSDIERTPELLRRHQPPRRAPGRPRRTDSVRLASEERSCAVKDTADRTDPCTCGHARMSHVAGRRSVCSLCSCDSFFKESLVIHDERAARNAYAKAAQHLTCGVQGCTICADRTAIPTHRRTP